MLVITNKKFTRGEAFPEPLIDELNRTCGGSVLLPRVYVTCWRVEFRLQAFEFHFFGFFFLSKLTP